MATVTGDVWTFITESTLVVEGRNPSYNPNEVWNPIEGEWTDNSALISAGGGRYKNRFVAIGHGVIYFGEV